MRPYGAGSSTDAPPVSPQTSPTRSPDGSRIGWPVGPDCMVWGMFSASPTTPTSRRYHPISRFSPLSWLNRSSARYACRLQIRVIPVPSLCSAGRSGGFVFLSSVVAVAKRGWSGSLRSTTFLSEGLPTARSLTLALAARDSSPYPSFPRCLLASAQMSLHSVAASMTCVAADRDSYPFLIRAHLFWTPQ